MSQIKEVKEATDIVALIGQHVSLQHSGSYYRGLCPFHSEKSPSFFVDEVLQRYKCFGCGEHGDALSFLQKYEGLTFGEALESLAQQAGITLKSFAKSPEDTLREDLLTILGLAKQYYHYILTEHTAGAIGRDYLKNRKVNAESIKVFQLGYAPEQWDGLINFLHYKKNFPLTLIEQAGLITTNRNGKTYDRFRGRLMFPLTDSRGRVVGFSGRKVLDPAAAAQPDAIKDAKYINSPETLLYHKSKMLYGFSELYQEIRKAGFVVVVEGEFDVISSAQAHSNAVVAIKGSALTTEHAKLLSRTVEKVCLALDSDSAGVAATKKAITALKNTTLQLSIIEIPQGKDPDELVKADPKAWRQAIKAAVSAHEFLIKAALRQHDATTPDGKRKIMQELLPVLVDVEHSVELEHYARILATALNSQFESVMQDIKHFQHKQKIGQNTLGSAKKINPDVSAQQKQSVEIPPIEKLELYTLFLLFALEPSAVAASAVELVDLPLGVSGTQKIVQLLLAHSNSLAQGAVFSLQVFARTLPSDLQELLFEICSNQEHLAITDGKLPAEVHKEFTNSLKKLRTELVRQEVTKINQRLMLLDEIENKTEQEALEQDQLLKKIVELQAKLK